MSVTWVALLRGINVGRAKRISMQDLRTMLESMGYADVRTLGQSGNAIFATSQRKPEPLEREISAHIRSEFGMEVVVLLRTPAELGKVVDANPFVASGAPSSELHAAFLSEAPPAATAAAFDHDAFLPDEFAFGDRVIYVRLPNGITNSILPNWDRALGVRVTQRNWNTTTRLRDVAG